jgi:hypothetical protein
MLALDAMISRTLPWAPLGLLALLCACSEPTTNYGPPEGLKGAGFPPANAGSSSSQESSSSPQQSSSTQGATSSSSSQQQTTSSAGDPDAGGGGDDAAMEMDTSKASSAPTFTELYADYFAPNSTPATVGSCGKSGCHNAGGTAPELDTQSDFYTNLTNIQGAPSTWPTLFTWTGGSMPENGPASDPAAAQAIAEWIDAGAPNN